MSDDRGTTNPERLAMVKINFQIEKRGDADVVHYAGPITEDSSVVLARLAEAVGKNVVFNFRKVNYVNSNGVRAWVLFLRDFQPGRTLSYEECTPTIVTQLNMIPGFLGNARVASVYVPIACQDCNQADQVLVEAADFPEGSATLSLPKCKKCGGLSVSVDTLEEYFEFATLPTS
jgi:hypothetical protein